MQIVRRWLADLHCTYYILLLRRRNAISSTTNNISADFLLRSQSVNVMR